MIQPLICVLFFFAGGCASIDGKREAALRDNPGCVWDEMDESLVCPLPWDSEEVKNLDPEEIEEMVKPKAKAKKKKK